MTIPNFNGDGDLPVGIRSSTMAEVAARFGDLNLRREDINARLTRIYSLAKGTGYLHRFIIFGSYITDKALPNDVHVILVMRDNFNLSACNDEAKALFDHNQATTVFGASVFWIRPSMLLLETVDTFLEHWQIKRDGARRGIVEIIE